MFVDSTDGSNGILTWWHTSLPDCQVLLNVEPFAHHLLTISLRNNFNLLHLWLNLNSHLRLDPTSQRFFHARRHPDFQAYLLDMVYALEIVLVFHSTASWFFSGQNKSLLVICVFQLVLLLLLLLDTPAINFSSYKLSIKNNLWNFSINFQRRSEIYCCRQPREKRSNP